MVGSPEHQWAVIGQVLADTSENGRLSIHYGQHAISPHDVRTPVYFDARHEEGVVAAGFFGVSPSQTRIALEIGGEAVVVDATTGERWAVARVAPLDPWDREFAEGRRDEVHFIDDDTVLVWSADGTLESRNFIRHETRRLFETAGWLTELRLVAGWAVVGVADARPLSPSEQEIVYDVSVGNAPPRAAGNIRQPRVAHWAVHVPSGRTMELPTRHVWPAAWGLVHKDEAGTLTIATLDGRDTVAARECTQDVLVVPGSTVPGVAHDCARAELQWVGMDGVAEVIAVEPLAPAATPEEAERIVQGGAVWAFRPNGERVESSAYSFPAGDRLILAPDERRAFVDQTDAGWLGRSLDSDQAPNGYDAVESVPGGDFILRKQDGAWQPVSRPAEGHTCVLPDHLPPELWGECFSQPEGTIVLNVAADGTALAIRGWHVVCAETGPVQPVWLNVRVLDGGSESSPPPPVSPPPEERTQGVRPSGWLGVRYSGRALTLPGRTTRITAGTRATRLPGGTFEGASSLGVGLGLTDFVEIGIDGDRVASAYSVVEPVGTVRGLVPVVLGPDQRAGDVPLYGRFHLGHVESGYRFVDAVLEAGAMLSTTRDAGGWLGVFTRALLPVSPWTFDFGVELNWRSAPDQAGIGVWVPFTVIAQLGDSLHVIGRTGIRWHHDGDVLIPASLELGYTFAQGARALMDLTLGFGFPSLFVPTSSGDRALTDQWQLTLGLRCFVGG